MSYKDKTKAPQQRARDLIQHMTLEEKVAQMTQIAYSEHPPEQSKEWARLGAGSFLHVIGDEARELQAIARSTRLGIPVLFGIDAIHGHGLHAGATIFPSQLAAACSWNGELIRQMGHATAKEVAADGLHWTFSPVLCLGRDTRWGRVNETFGEDAFLAGELGAAIIKGYQGDDLSAPDSILACAKHYIGYGEAVGGRDSCDTQMTFRKLRDTFLSPFKKAVEAGCATVMTAYGSIDGTPFNISEKALRTILKEELGFDGIVVTDWDNVASLVTNQHVAPDIMQASTMTVQAGNDMIMRTDSFYQAALDAVRLGILQESVIDEAVLRILTIKFRKGLFDREDTPSGGDCFSCKEHLELARELARQSIVLLENRDSILPLKKTVRSVAVIGANADDLQAQYGDWTYFSHPKPNPSHPCVEPYCTIRQGMRQLAEKHEVSFQYCEGYSDDAISEELLTQAVHVAQESDCVILVVGDSIEHVGEGKDTARLELPPAQVELFRQLRATGKPLVTVLQSSKPMIIEELAGGSNALLLAFNGGMFGGLAVAQTIFGEHIPCGKLPISFPRHSGQLPVYYNQLGGWHGGKYADMPQTPLYCFGYGLSYARFKLSALALEQRQLQVTVENVGDCAGWETVQFYFNDCVSSVMTPEKQLFGFARVYLEPGQKTNVSYQIQDEMLALVNAEERTVTEAGEFEIMVGNSSRDTDLQRVSFII